jgi:hypothetical protein
MAFGMFRREDRDVFCVNMKKGWAGLIFWFRTETDGMFL